MSASIAWNVLERAAPQLFAVDFKTERNVFYLMDDLLLKSGVLGTNIFRNLPAFKTDSRRLAGAEILRRVASRTLPFGKPFEMLTFKWLADPGAERGYHCPLTIELVTTTVHALVESGLLRRFGHSCKGYAPSYALNFQMIFEELVDQFKQLGMQFKDSKQKKKLLKEIMGHKHFPIACVLTNTLFGAQYVSEEQVLSVLGNMGERVATFKEMLAAAENKAKKAQATRQEKLQESPILRWKTTVKKDLDVEARVVVYPKTVIAYWDTLVEGHEVFKGMEKTNQSVKMQAKVKSWIMNFVRQGWDEDKIRKHLRLIVEGWAFMTPNTLSVCAVNKEGKAYSFYLPHTPMLEILLATYVDTSRQLLELANRFEQPVDLAVLEGATKTSEQPKDFNIYV